MKTTRLIKLKKSSEIELITQGPKGLVGSSITEADAKIQVKSDVGRPPLGVGIDNMRPTNSTLRRTNRDTFAHASLSLWQGLLERYMLPS